ncbi:sensor histidine kinase [Opitutus terrae]|uniref:histidine kinase n=1 Tax=Opitutus terrae (strain DSM 11246 / JCM 15787 / PB90-1) TaxID=452637 RepID=B1ZN85_OPITP|nr:ATP-binding protein [Opitutus terrae]ACB73454.1 histidine kinase [Opitutus terrae PB90-1]
MNNFKQTLYEALLVAFGKTLAKYNAFAQATILRDVGRELIDYLNRHGFAFEETGSADDLARLTELFVKNGFCEKLEVQPASRGQNFVWHNLYGREAYKELHEVSDNPFLACPLNLCLYYIADKNHKSMHLLNKSFATDGAVVESQYEVVDEEPLEQRKLDPLVIENARLYQLAREKAESLEKEVAQRVRAEAELQAQKQALEKEIEERKRVEREVENVHRQLVEASHRAGQAEVASSVLHNIGNVLNSVNVSTSLIGDRVRNLRLGNLARTADLIEQHRANLPQFLTEDDRGKRLPHFLAELSRHLNQEQTELAVEVAGLERAVERIKQIVAAQQTYARAPGVEENASIAEIVDEAIRVQACAAEKNAVLISVDIGPLPNARLDRRKILQVLVNLLHNARHACEQTSRADKQIIVRVRPDGDRGVLIEVADNGVGIARENLTRIFAPGFTTRASGSGFGLHSAALAAAEMGGSLIGQSEGPGHGATFILRLPFGAAG